MQLLNSIELIEPRHVYRTGTNPLLVHCSDLNYYISKYNRTNTVAYKLAAEYLSASFLRLWNLHVPPFNLIHIRDEDINATTGLGIIKIEQPCFGSLRINDAIEVSEYYNEINQAQYKKFTDKTEFLSIAFFDIWIGNDDRNINNFNLLISIEEDGQHFVPIDHGDCFHTLNHSHENYPLTEQESILISPILNKLFKVSELTNEAFLAQMKDSWYLCIERCKANLKNLLEDMPEAWLIPKEQFHDELNAFLFHKDWFETCFATFKEYILLNV